MERRVWLRITVLALAVGALAAAVAAAVAGHGGAGRLWPAALWLSGALGLGGVLAAMVVRDLRRLRRAAQREASARARLEAALEQGPDGVAIYDGSHRLMWCNAAYRSLLGVDGDNLRAGDTMASGLGGGVREFRGNAGRRVAVEQTVLETGEILSTLRDVTGEKAAEARERATRERFRQHLSAAGGWIWESDVLHRFSVLTPVRPEIDPSDLDWLVGRHLSELAPGNAESSSALESCLQDMAMQRRMRDVTMWLHDGRRLRSVRLSGVPRFDSSGAFLGYRGVGSFTATGVLPQMSPWDRESAAAPAAALPIEPAPTAAAAFSSPPRRLLLAEDGESNRLLAQSILERMGYQVDSVENGRQAVDAVRDGDYCAVLMDVWMPELNGLEATAAIRALPEPKGIIPIVAMTAHASPEDRQRCMDAGMDEHLAKPIDRARLSEILEGLVGDRSRRAGGEPAPVDGDPADDVSLPKIVDDSIIAELRADAGSSLVDELIATYMAETDDRLERMSIALGDGRLEDIGADAHAMKSSSGTFGALRLEALAAQLEAASTGQDGPRTAELMKTLPGLVAETWAALARRGHAAARGDAGE